MLFWGSSGKVVESIKNKQTFEAHKQRNERKRRKNKNNNTSARF